MTFLVDVDETNPGQFFACCGVFELASRLAAKVTACFEAGSFAVEGAIGLDRVLMALATVGVEGEQGAVEEGDSDESDDKSLPMVLGKPFDLRLDWWLDRNAGGAQLKVWAGTMNAGRIFSAMKAPLGAPVFHESDLLDVCRVVFDPSKPTAKVEPFYFDARRTSNAHSRDVGFSINDLKLPTLAAPALEALCLIGLQRFRPAQTSQRRLFDYCAWPAPLPIELAAPVVSGRVSVPATRRYRFETWFRTGQRKHKGFRSASVVSEGD